MNFQNYLLFLRIHTQKTGTALCVATGGATNTTLLLKSDDRLSQPVEVFAPS
jgi:hypothetical protein